MSEKTLFTKIIDREIPSEIVFEDDNIIVIKDIHPDAPVHLLGITKKPYANMHELLMSEDKDLLWELMTRLAKIAEEMGIDTPGYRLLTNTGKDANQIVPHLHVHLMGGGMLHSANHP
jgi:histidine triad (HIT) family protein